jgi:hypothetical protein
MSQSGVSPTSITDQFSSHFKGAIKKLPNGARALLASKVACEEGGGAKQALPIANRAACPTEAQPAPAELPDEEVRDWFDSL